MLGMYWLPIFTALLTVVVSGQDSWGGADRRTIVLGRHIWLQSDAYPHKTHFIGAAARLASPLVLILVYSLAMSTISHLHREGGITVLKVAGRHKFASGNIW